MAAAIAGEGNAHAMVAVNTVGNYHSSSNRAIRDSLLFPLPEVIDQKFCRGGQRGERADA